MEINLKISEEEFLALAKKEECEASLSERFDAVSPEYFKYVTQVKKLLKGKILPPWRTNREKTLYIGDYKISPTEAFPVSYGELAFCPKLFGDINFELGKDYFITSNIIAFHCSSCGIRLVKDGNHRLLQCAVKKSDREITVYEVSSSDWRQCRVDMKNFCKCISNE